MATESSVFTFFRESRFGRSSLVYPGSHNKVDEIKDTDPEYTVDYGHGKVLLFGSHGRASEPLLSGRGNLFRTQFTVTGFHSIVVLKPKRFASHDWKFTNYSGCECMWKVKFGSGSWRLVDGNERIVAVFDRALHKLTIQGKLTVYGSVSQSDLALIILSCRLVHINIKKSESAGRGGGS